MSVLIKKRITAVVGRDISKAIPDTQGCLQPERKEKVNWDPYHKHYRTTRKKKKEMAVKAKVAVIKKEVVAKKEAVKVAKGKTIDDLWVEVLKASVGKKLTDKAIAVQMSAEATKLTGKKREYDEASVAGHRSGYNCGKFSIQKGIKPAVRIEKFDPEVKK